MLTFLKPRRKGWDDPFWCTFDAMLMHCWCIPSNTFAICWNTFNYLLPLNCSIASCPSILSSILLVVHYFSLWYPEVRVMMQWERRRRGRLTYSSELPPSLPRSPAESLIGFAATRYRGQPPGLRLFFILVQSSLLIHRNTGLCCLSLSPCMVLSKLYEANGRHLTIVGHCSVMSHCLSPPNAYYSLFGKH